MATGAAADGFLRPIYEGCISGYDHGVERRPYHRNCGCALHSNNNKSRKTCTHKLPYNNVSYPIRRAWSEGSLALNNANYYYNNNNNNNNSPHSSPSSSPAHSHARSQQCYASLDRDEHEERANKLGVLFEI